MLAGLLVSGTVSNTTETTASLAPIVVVGAQSTNTCETAFAVGELIGFNQSAAAQDNTIETVFAAGEGIGITQPIESAATIETEFADVAPSLIRGFSADLSAVAEFADSAARNIIGITDGAGYITTDYAEADYFSEGTGLTLSADSSILEVDANIIRSDGTILFEGDFAAQIQPGFQIDAGIVTQGLAAFEISPYTTAGTGLLFAAAAELEQAAAVAVVAGSLLVAAAQEFVIDSTAQAQSTTAILGTTQLDFAFAVASDSESRPSILAQIDLLDGTGSLTATALVDQSSRAAIELDTLSLQALAGYTLFGNTTNTIGINADFSSEGRIYYIDEYYLSRVERESRLYPVVAELHSLLVDPETRVNTTVAENTALRVEPETRIARPELLPTSLVGARLRRIPV